jgi:hypothetical protein
MYNLGGPRLSKTKMVCRFPILQCGHLIRGLCFSVFLVKVLGNVEDSFLLIQSIRSAKAEPFKQWLAKEG